MIKYDLRDKKRILIVALIITVLTGISILLSGWNHRYFFFSTTLRDLAMVASVFLCPASVALWITCLDCVCYLKRMRRHGYELPLNKRDYDRELKQLKREAAEPINEGKMSVESVVLALVSLCVSGFYLICAIKFWGLYRQVQDMMVLGLIFYAVLILGWIGQIFFYWKQRRVSQYRDDVEPGEDRKVRKDIVSGLAAIVFLVVICSLGTFMLDQGVNCVINARAAALRESK